MQLKRITKPADLLMLATVRKWVGLGEDTSQDDILEMLAEAATTDVEDYLRQPLVNHNWRLTFDVDEFSRRDPDEDEWATPFDVRLPLELANISAVTAVRVYDENGDATTLDAAEYEIDGRSQDATIYIDSGVLPIPLRPTECLEVEVTAGFGADATFVQAKFKRVALSLVAYDFEHRGDEPDVEARNAVLESLAGDRVIRL